MTDELRKAEIAALVRELESYEARAKALDSGDEHDRYKAKAELVREQLRVRGEKAEAPQKRATTRQRNSGERR